MSKAEVLVFDIETCRTRNDAIAARIRQEALDKEPASNTRKELKLAWDTEKAREERAKEALDKTAVDVLLAEVLCVCWKTESFGSIDSAMDCEGESLACLAEKWDDAAGPETVWIGHNVVGFDLPVLLNRWRRYNIQPPEYFPVWNGKRWIGPVYDTMLRAPVKNGLGFVSLTALCDAYGVPGAKERIWNGEPMDGSRVGEVFEAGEHDLILDYCMDDVEVEEALYYRMTVGGKWGTYSRRDAVAERIAEIEEAGGLTEGARALAILDVLRGAGLVPRAA